MKEAEDSRKKAAQLYRAAMKLSGITYEELSEKLNKAGEKQQSAALKNKISRGDFSAKFFLLSLKIMKINFAIHK